jgi:ferredoxin
MSDAKIPMHYVCTHATARRLVDEQRRFWVSNCGCREQRGSCTRSRMDVCLMFTESDQGSGSGLHAVTRAEVEAILREAAEKRLVARPFRDATRTATDGICFCCDDCCGYFLDAEEICDPGEQIQQTDLSLCTHCGVCVDACYFHALSLVDGQLTIARERCFGCGLCLDACPEGCIEMVARG